jgi:flagellar capping protein FliD
MCIRAIYKIIKGFVEAYNRLTKKETPVKAS